MFSPNSLWAVLTVVALAGAGVIARADTATETPAAAASVTQAVAEVTVTAQAGCEGSSPREARRLAKEAQRNGAHRQAAECFRVAGDHNRADHAMVRAAAEQSADTKERLSANAETAKVQMRRLRDAFR